LAVTNTVSLPNGPEGVVATGASQIYVTDAGASSQTVSVLDGLEAPSPPTVTSSAAGDAEISLTWSAPADGGIAVTSYEITAAPTTGSTAVVDSVPASDLSATVTGLGVETTYDVTVTADNAVATGNPSVPISLTPIGPPSAPYGVSVKAGNRRATVRWNAPANNGGSPITSCQVIPYIGSNPQKPVTVSPSTTSKRITGLKNGTTYTFVVTATNKVGTSRSQPSAPVTPATVPGAAALKGTAGKHRVTLTWTPPTATGGAPIRGYEVYMGTSRTTITSTPVNKSLIRKNARSYKVTGLKNGTRYYFILKAVNAVGLGARSNVVKLRPRS
jgi:hypothetical protein